MDITMEEVQHYLDVVLPNIRKELTDETLTDSEKLEVYGLYEGVLRLVAPHDFASFNDYLELDEDKREPNRGFHHHRRDHMFEVYDTLNKMEVYDEYDVVLISLPPRVGKTTYGIRFLSWIMGKYPEYTQLGTSYSDSITSSFYSGIMEIVNGQRYKEVFTDAPLMNQNAKRQEIWLKVLRRYPTIAFVPIGGSVTGRVEANNYLYVDDIVSGMEEALSFSRLDKLWAIFTGNFYQRMKQGCKMVVIATRWSVHDPMSRIERMYEGNPRFKSIKMPATDENGNSNFKFAGGFDEKYYEDIQKALDPLTYNAVFMQNPIEREGLLYNADELSYYTDLPEGRPDSIIAICDSKNLGKDYVASAVGYVYDDLVYIDDVVYNNGLPAVTQPAVANLWIKHNVVLADVELNNGGNYYADKVQELVREGGGRTSVRTFFSSNNKDVKIITYSDFVKTNFVFRSPSTYHPRSEYAKFMEGLFSWTQTGKNPHDDAPDAIAMMAQKFQDMTGNRIKLIDRRSIGL